MKKQEVTVTARTVEQAIAEGARQIGAPEEAVKYETLQEPKKGFLGIGEQPARVRVWYLPDRTDKAEEFLRGLLSEMEVDANVQLKEKDDGLARFNIDGESTGLLIGYHGETLDAIQYLTSLIANHKDPRDEDGGTDDEETDDNYLRVIIDAGGYRVKREEMLRGLALKTAARVRRTGHAVTLEPMNPSDRRVVHSTLQSFDGVDTESTGYEGHRCVTIFPEGHPPQATEPRPSHRRRT